MEISKEMYYKELAHALQSLRSHETSVGKLEAQKAGRVHGAVLVPVQSAETRRADGVSSRLKARKLKIQEEPIAQFKGMETLIPQLKAFRPKEFLLTPGSLTVCV